MNALIPALLCIALLSACQRAEPTSTDTSRQATPPASSLVLFGNGFPTDGAPCRRVGESEATSQWLDHTADLVGCPDAASASALGGKIVATIDGMTVVSVPHGSPAAKEAGDGASGPKPWSWSGD